MKKLTDTITRILDPSGGTPPTRPVPASNRSGLYLGQGVGGPMLAYPDEHVLVLGPPRSGKTSRIVAPAVTRHRGPVVITSTKPDVIRTTIHARQSLGQCWYWDPSGTTVAPPGVEPLGWSPIDGCESWDVAVARAHVLAGAARPEQSAHDAHWVERAEALLAPLLHAAALTDADLAVLLSWLHRRELVQPTSILGELRARRAADLLEGISHTDARELSGIFSTADSILAAYRTDAALSTTVSASFDPDLFAASTDTLYLVSPAAAQAVHAALVVALLDQIRTATYRWHPRPPLLFALDEVANIAPLPDLPSTLAEGGSQGLVVLACLQDLSQARARWAKAAEGFLTLFTYKLVLPGIADVTTLRAISALAGEVDVPVRSDSTNRGRSWGSSTSWTTRRQTRLPVDAVAAGSPGTALLVAGIELRRVGL